MTRQQRKDARTNPYNTVRAVACRQVGLDYHKVSLPTDANPQHAKFQNTPGARREKSWEMTQPDSLGRLIPDAGISPFPGQTRANGRPL